MKNSLIPIIVILVIIAVITYFYLKKCKHLKLPNVYLITGAVKSGKSCFSVAMAVKQYKKNLFGWYLAYPIRLLIDWIRSLKTKRTGEVFDTCIPLKPMLYSNIPLARVKCNLFTKDILLRKVRIPNKSVVLLDEVSLVADSMLFNDKQVNESLQLFVKLFGHYSHGGTLIVNTQSLKDCHFSFKRCVAQYLYIYHMTKGLFFNHFEVREMLYQSDDESSTNVTNNVNEDIETSTLKIWHLKKYMKMYDCYCYSCFTDNLKYQVDYDRPIKSKKDDLKAYVLVSLQDFKTLKEVKKNENLQQSK